MNNSETKFETIISSQSRFFSFNFKELWTYKDLIYFFVKRDFVAVYKQTILGPLWYLVQPIVTSFVMILVFTKIARLDTGLIPPVLFYFSGNMLWMYFADNLIRTSDTFITNSSIFGKVYFPRLTAPISSALSGMISFVIQYFLFFCIYLYYCFSSNLEFKYYIFFTPFLLIYLAVLSFSFGILISALTTKYRDLKFVLKFGLQLWMYASPIAYSLEQVPNKYLSIYMFNPLVPVIEIFRFFHFGYTLLSPIHLIANLVFLTILFFGSILLFNKVERSFLDSV